MDSTRSRMIGVAVVVCGFSVGMAGLLNYFKYRSTANRLVAERLAVTARAVENTIQSSLALGVQLSDISSLPGTLDREHATDNLIQGIDLFGDDGVLLYSTDRLRLSRPAPAAWLAAARHGSGTEWVAEGDDAATGLRISNNFGLVVGYLAVRYSGEQVREATRAVGAEIALSSLLVFLASAAVSSFALVATMRRIDTDVERVEAALRAGDSARATAIAARGPFGPPMLGYVKATRLGESELAQLRLLLSGGGRA